MCGCALVFVQNRWPHRLIPGAEIWHGMLWVSVPVHVMGAGQVRSQTSPRCLTGGLSARGTSPAMIPRPFRLKLCREIGTHPRRLIFYVRTGYPNPHGQGANKCGSGVHAAHSVCGLPGPWMLQWAWTGALQQAGALQRVLRMHCAKPGTPARVLVKS